MNRTSIITFLTIVLLSCSDSQGEKSEPDKNKITDNETEVISEHTIDALIEAIRAEDLQKVRELAESGEIDLNQQENWDSKTPLIIACEVGNNDIVDVLVKYGADIEKGAGEYLEYTNPLFTAINQGNVKLVDYLLDGGAEYRNEVVWYVNLNDKLMFDYLLKKGMKVNATNLIDAEYELSRLGYALLYEGRDEVEFLISKGAEIDHTILFDKIDPKHLYIFDLADFKFDTISDQIRTTVGEPSIYSILTYKNKEVISHFLSNGFNPNPNTIATMFPRGTFKEEEKKADEPICDMILAYKEKNDPDFDINDTYEFHQWVIYHPQLSETVPDNRTTLLSLAVIGEHEEAVKILLKYGAKPEVKDEHNKSALDYAQKNDKMLSLLQ
ncbi:MAG: ankyrin repeat domain-containing protein [Crocinitomicaceae bacterium]